MKKLVVLFLVLGMLPACAATNSTVRRIPFPEAEYAALKTDGSGVIGGHVFIETKYGEKLPKSGAKVVLNPVTSYSVQWYKVTAVMKQRLETPDTRISKYIKEAITDSKGRFEIAGVPAGEYFLSSPLVWEGPWPVRTVTPMIPQGRFVVLRIFVHEKEKLDVSLKCGIRLDEASIDVSLPRSEKMPAWTELTY